MPLLASCNLEVPAAILVFWVNVCPPSVLNAPQKDASSFATPSVSPGPPVPRSARASYHTTARLPLVGSSAILGRNWLLVGLSSFTRTGLLHVLPVSSEYCTQIFVLSLSSECPSG